MTICAIDECTKEATAPRGWCWTHYGRWRRNGGPNAVFTQKECTVTECTRTSRVGGMCDMHYRRTKAHGDPNIRLLMQAGICDEEGCNLNTFGRGKCQRHYHAMWAANGGRAKISATMSRRRARMSGAKVLATDLGWPQLLAAGDGTCYLCGIPCNPLDYRELLNRGGWVQRICGPTYPTLDHIVPLSRGGSHEQNNAALACMKCNRNKSAKVARETKLSHPATDAGKDLKG